MKLIVSYLNALRRYVTREFYYVMTDLVTNYGWKHIEPHELFSGSGPAKDRLFREFGELPETILFWESYETLSEHAEDIYRLGCRTLAVMTDDLHWWNEGMRRMRTVSFALCDTVLSPYAYAWREFYPEFNGFKKVVWTPHSTSPDFMLSWNRHPANSIFLSGAINRGYPLRLQMKELHSRRSYRIAYQCHPGYHCGYDYAQNRDVGRAYAETINKHRAGFTDSGVHKYVVAKYFEIPATGALLLADDSVSGPLKALGFIENKHYVPVSTENLEERIQYVLDERNHEELDDIRRRGQELVLERHKASDRAREIDRVLSG